MDRINLGYSTKNIPIPSERSYLLQLVEKVEAVIKRMQLKAALFNKNNKEEDKHPIERYELKSENWPTQIMNLYHSKTI